MIKVPVVFIVFNRPETTRTVFERIREARPPELLVIADGPRPGVANDIDNCRAVREIVDKVDWPCVVHKNYSDSNLGCRKRVSTGLDWAFSQVSEAVILEDDCLPETSFFRFCEDLLGRYRNNEKVMCISGTNSLFGADIGTSSYYFASFNQLWGWASWRRSWKLFDSEMKKWPKLRDERFLSKFFNDKGLSRYWERIFELTYVGHIMTWDYQLILACMNNNGLFVVPRCNLISNIGFDQDATSTKLSHCLANIPVEPLKFPLVHPPSIVRSNELELITARNTYFRPILPLRLVKWIYRIRGWKQGS